MVKLLFEGLRWSAAFAGAVCLGRRVSGTLTKAIELEKDDLLQIGRQAGRRAAAGASTAKTLSNFLPIPSTDEGLETPFSVQDNIFLLKQLVITATLNGRTEPSFRYGKYPLRRNDDAKEQAASFLQWGIQVFLLKKESGTQDLLGSFRRLRNRHQTTKPSINASAQRRLRICVTHAEDGATAGEE